MQYFQIIKGSQTTTVDEFNFKKFYEPQGWRKDETQQPIDTTQSNESIIKIMQANAVKKICFSDELFFSEFKGGVKNGL